MDPNLSHPEQIEVAKRLQTKWLLHMERLLDEGEVTSTDLATIARLLSQNGWVLDSSRLPSRLRDKLTAEFDPTEADELDGIIPIRKTKTAGG